MNNLTFAKTSVDRYSMRINLPYYGQILSDVCVKMLLYSKIIILCIYIYIYIYIYIWKSIYWKKLFL